MPLGHLINLCQQYLTCVYRMGSRKCHLFKRHLTAQPKSGTAINEHSWVPVGRTRDRDKLMVQCITNVSVVVVHLRGTTFKE